MADRLIIACCVVLALAYFYGTSQIPSLEIGDPLGPKTFPYLLGIALLAATGLLVVEHWKETRSAAPEPAKKTDKADRRHLPVLAGVVAWFCVYFAVFETLGFVIATSIFLLALMAWFNRGRWLANILSAVLFSVGSYVMFAWLDVRLPAGILPF
ncbi:MAG TPA: tripartite tricarboxylate transporter TctB family protein [Burkholderiales bacterium]|nr:tripartite tricarboxylate transporter TctB family protein [Burkholderiales bacterium]